jgi:hydroxycarboxylate dehydrogenase B
MSSKRRDFVVASISVKHYIRGLGMAEYLNFRARSLTRAIEAIVLAGGSSAREARLVAGALVGANLAGHDSHGVGMIPRYVESLQEGGLVINQTPKINFDGGAMIAIDGQRGYGQVIGEDATAIAIARAKQSGSCIMGLGNAHHLGRIGQWAEQATAEGLVSIHFVNVLSRPIVAAWGGGDGRMGTNPCCIGIPVPDAPPIILDYATSVVAQGKMRVAHNKGEQVPPGRLIDDQGNPTNDPRYVVIDPIGALMPFGEHKGSGMGLICELLGGALAGGGTWHREYKGTRGVLNGMLTILIDPVRLGTANFFATETSAFLDWLRQTPTAAGFDKLRVAGEPEREMRLKRNAEGVPVDSTTWNDICAAGARLGLGRAHLESLASAAA